MTHPLAEVIAALDVIAPLSYAESWDNVGVLLPGKENPQVRSVLFAIDLTIAVTHEAVERAVDLVVAYHPPIFKGFLRLRRAVPMESNVLELIERKIALYSPHTALDSAPSGLNDWLVRLAGKGDVAPITPTVADARAGAGRVMQLESAEDPIVVAARFREGTAAPHARLADRRPNEPIFRVAVAAGAGGSLFERAGVCPATNQTRTLFVSGELRHHDGLTFTEQGHAVLLLEHDASERGFLQEYSLRLKAAFGSGSIETSVARADVNLVRALP